MLYRVANLSKSSDKRLGNLFSTQFRQRGVVGYRVDGHTVNPEEYKDFVWLKSANGVNLGVYRAEELEEVTEKQLDLEAALSALLTVFPNQSPSTVLDVNTTDEFDGLAVETLVPMLRKQFKRELSLEFAFGQDDSGF